MPFLGVLTGWYSLSEALPDRPAEPALLTLRSVRATMGLVTWREFGGSTVEACGAGLRLRANRMVVPLGRPVFIPWNALTVRRVKTWRLGASAELSFAGCTVGLESVVADALWRAAPLDWPEPGSPPPPETRRETLRRVLGFREAGVPILFFGLFGLLYLLMAPGFLKLAALVLPAFAGILFGLPFYLHRRSRAR